MSLYRKCYKIYLYFSAVNDAINIYSEKYKDVSDPDQDNIL